MIYKLNKTGVQFRPPAPPVVKHKQSGETFEVIGYKDNDVILHAPTPENPSNFIFVARELLDFIDELSTAGRPFLVRLRGLWSAFVALFRP